MGDPKFPRRSFDAPSHPWRGERIKAETETCKLYGLKNKRELWKAQAVLRNLRTQSKNLQARVRLNDEQAELERDLLLKKLGRLGLLPMEGSTLDDVLGLTPEAVLNAACRRWCREGSRHHPEAGPPVHRARACDVDGHKVTIPGYLVKRGEEDKIAFNPHSPISNELHPLRAGPQLESGPAAPAPRPEKTPNSEKVEKVIKSIEGDEAEDIADLPEIQEE